MQRKEWLFSFLFSFPVGAELSYISYEDSLAFSLLFGVFGGLSVFLVLYLFRSLKKGE